MRSIVSLIALLALSACVTPAPDDGAPVPKQPATPAAQTTQTAAADTVAKDKAAAATDQAKPKDQIVITNDNPNISDTQDFAAVTARVTPEEDAARLKALRKEYKFIDPSQVKLPKTQDGVNVAKYALETTNKVGEKLYRRFNPLGVMASQRCRSYSVPDEAQAAFLKAGGPKRDPLGLDPDGDGFACNWSPEFYRKMLKK